LLTWATHEAPCGRFKQFPDTVDIFKVYSKQTDSNRPNLVVWKARAVYNGLKVREGAESA